jgi:uncharacterized protein (DUF488 family)
LYVSYFTIGHSNRSLGEFLAMLHGHGIEQVIDVRTAPGSRRNPQFMKAALAASLDEQGIAYSHMPSLGGFRKPRADSPNTAWRNESFRGYADYMGTSEFTAALDDLVVRVGDIPTALLCSEAVPWRCHRSLIADALTVRGFPVEHIMTKTQTKRHGLTPFAHVEGDHITYPPSQVSSELQ